MYAWPVADAVRRGDRIIGQIQDPAAPPSPWLGQVGMLYEYNADDMNGPRSCSAYVFDGWQNNLISAATLLALNRWGDQFGRSELEDLQRRMIVGSEDFRHKLIYGWKGRKNGHASNKRGFGRHHRIMFLLWDAYAKQWLGAKDQGR
jgi:hypothetical protein